MTTIRYRHAYHDSDVTLCDRHRPEYPAPLGPVTSARPGEPCVLCEPEIEAREEEYRLRVAAARKARGMVV